MTAGASRVRRWRLQLSMIWLELLAQGYSNDTAIRDQRAVNDGI